ncbi:MAG: hypothetical protein ABW201_19400 [Candidatus Thiodiazotropha sp.]
MSLDSDGQFGKYQLLTHGLKSGFKFIGKFKVIPIQLRSDAGLDGNEESAGTAAGAVLDSGWIVELDDIERRQQMRELCKRIVAKYSRVMRCSSAYICRSSFELSRE